MKTHSNELFLLIKALTPKEKLFLKVFGTKHQNNVEYSYLALFDVLNEMKQYDEKVLRNKLDKLGYKHNINKAKNYLTRAILKSLTEYHTDSSVDSIIENQIFQAEILYKKNLGLMADKILLKAEKLALEYEKHEYLLMICSLKSNMALENSDIERLNEYMKTEIKKEQKYLKQFVNTIDYRNLAVEMTVLNQSPMVVSEDKTKNIHLEKLFENPMLENSASALTLYAKRHFYQLNYSRFHKYKKWNEGSDGMFAEWVEYLEKKKYLLQNLPELYLRALNLLLGALGNLPGKKEEIEITFAKARNFYDSLPQKKLNKSIHSVFAIVMVNFFYAQSIFFGPDKMVAEFAKLNSSVRAEMNIAGYFNIAWAYFFLRNFHEALSCINKVVNTKNDFRKDLQASGRSCLLMVHYELGNIDMLPHIAKSGERWLIKNNYTPKDFDKQFLDFFRYKLPKLNTPEEIFKSFSILLTDLKKLSPDEVEVYWLESKVQNRPLLDIIKERKK